MSAWTQRSNLVELPFQVNEHLWCHGDRCHSMAMQAGWETLEAIPVLGDSSSRWKGCKACVGRTCYSNVKEDRQG